MELKSLEVDFSRIKYWASRLNPQVVIEEPEARGQYIVSLFGHSTYSRTSTDGTLARGTVKSSYIANGPME